MSNPKYRTPLPTKKLKVEDPVIQRAIDLGQAIEKHKQKQRHAAIYIADPEWRDSKLKIKPDKNKSPKKWWQFWKSK